MSYCHYILVVGWGTLLMVIDLFVSDEKKRWPAGFTAVGLSVALLVTGVSLVQRRRRYLCGGRAAYGGVLDNLAIFLNGVLLLTGLLAVLISTNFLRDNGLERLEYYMLLFFPERHDACGMANDLILIFLALEPFSIPLYIMSSFCRSQESKSRR
ncbi:MAG: hypothetical protein M5U34_29065 [Chloroflexi bacterium]|nr:hypothetical protein [Chloroflexota bacterium]